MKSIISALLILSCGVIGCGPQTEETSKTVLATSPEAVFDAYKTAAEAPDSIKMTALLSDATIESLVKPQMSYCFKGYAREVHPELLPESQKKDTPDAVRESSVFLAAKECGVDENILKQITKDGDGTPTQEIMDAAAKSITDKRLFAARTLDIARDFENGIGSGSDPFAVWNEATIRDIKINGDRAAGMVTIKDRETEFGFIKTEDGQWRFNMVE